MWLYPFCSCCREYYFNRWNYTVAVARFAVLLSVCRDRRVETIEENEGEQVCSTSHVERSITVFTCVEREVVDQRWMLRECIANANNLLIAVCVEMASSCCQEGY